MLFYSWGGDYVRLGNCTIWGRVMDHFELAKKVTPWGSQTRSKSYKRFPDNYPRFIDGAKGCHVVSGEKGYLDFISALGPIILGYQDEYVDSYVMDQIRFSGNLFSLPSRLEAEVAEMLTKIIPCAEMVHFLKNGGDATMAAVRLARAYTGRKVVLNKGYHGWAVFDQLTSFEDLNMLKNYPDWDYVAAILVEPELFNGAELLEMKSLCEKYGAILIFDEVISGFRIAMGGVQEFLGVIPDLACFSKAMANGYPISALVGKGEIMERLEKDVFVSTTFGGDTIGLAACMGTIRKMKKENVINHLWETGSYLREELLKLIDEYQFPMTLYGFSPMIHFKVPEDVHALFLQEMIKRGIMIYNSHNLNFCHNRTEINKLLEVYVEIFPLIIEGKVKLEGNPIGNTQTFRQWRT